MSRRVDAEQAGREDCETVVSEGTDAAELLKPGQMCPDEALISAMGRAWVIRAAGGEEDSDEAWEALGLPWCERYNAAYVARARELANEVTDDQIEALGNDAGSAGDLEMVLLCAQALAGNATARAQCEKAILWTRAQQ